VARLLQLTHPSDSKSNTLSSLVVVAAELAFMLVAAAARAV
jgi:hypothetical protein